MRRTQPGLGRVRARNLLADSGSMSVEMVLITPVLVAFLLLVVAGGRFVAVRGEVEAASRDAVRAASMERSRGAAQAAAQNTVTATMSGRWRCSGVQLLGSFAPGDTITVELTCRVPLDDLGLIGLPGSRNVSAQSSAPLDLYRRTG